jgi:hypothetical protein
MERPGSCAGAARDANLIEDIADVSLPLMHRIVIPDGWGASSRVRTHASRDRSDHALDARCNLLWLCLFGDHDHLARTLRDMTSITGWSDAF